MDFFFANQVTPGFEPNHGKNEVKKVNLLGLPKGGVNVKTTEDGEKSVSFQDAPTVMSSPSKKFAPRAGEHVDVDDKKHKESHGVKKQLRRLSGMVTGLLPFHHRGSTASEKSRTSLASEKPKKKEHLSLIESIFVS